MNTLVILFILGFASAAEFPKKWTRCPVSPATDNKDSECLKKTVTNIVKDLSDGGEESLGMRSMDPFEVKKITVGQGNPQSPVNLKVDFINPNLIGLSGLKITYAGGKLSSAKNWTMTVKAEGPRFGIVGHYKINGKILVLPIVGEGNSSLNFENLKAVGRFDAQPNIKNGKEYLKLTGRSISLAITKMTINLENLFNGDKALGDNMNKILNDNWELLYQELRPSMEDEIVRHLAKYSKSILEKIPYDELVIME